MRYDVWGRVTFVHPGKHGKRDLRVELGSIAPTLAETLAMLWGHFKAEDRYDAAWHEGRGMFKRLVDEIYAARTWAEARRVVEKCDASISPARSEPPLSFTPEEDELFDGFWHETGEAA